MARVRILKEVSFDPFHLTLMYRTSVDELRTAYDARGSPGRSPNLRFVVTLRLL
jgi:hypothetical protein